MAFWSGLLGVLGDWCYAQFIWWTCAIACTNASWRPMVGRCRRGLPCVVDSLCSLRCYDYLIFDALKSQHDKLREH